MTFLDLLRSILHLEMPKMMGSGSDWTIFCVFGQILDKSGPKIPNSFRKSRPHTASQAKVPCRKWSYTDPLVMRFSKKCVTEDPKPLTFLSNFNFFERIGKFFLKKLFFILSRLR